MHVRSRTPAQELIRAQRRERVMHRVVGWGLVVELIVVLGIFAGLILSSEAPPVAPSFLGTGNEPRRPDCARGVEHQ